MARTASSTASRAVAPACNRDQPRSAAARQPSCALSRTSTGMLPAPPWTRIAIGIKIVFLLQSFATIVTPARLIFTKIAALLLISLVQIEPADQAARIKIAIPVADIFTCAIAERILQVDVISICRLVHVY